MDEFERRRRLIQVGAALIAAAFIVGVLVLVGQSGSDGGGRIQGGEETAALFAGIPQDGKLLGSPRAGVTVAEFADLQCPFCAQYAGDVLPDLVRRYVRRGRVQMELNVVRFLGPDSDPGARAAVAAGLQDRMWQFAEVFYRNQGVENSGYVDEEFIHDVAAAVPGLDAERLMRDSASARVQRVVAANESRARRLGVTGTPNFFLARRGRTAKRLVVRSLELDTFVTPLRRLTGRR
jgi:protein-disulfide isomerase